MKGLFLHGAEAVIVALLFLAKQPNRVTPRAGCAGAGSCACRKASLNIRLKLDSPPFSKGYFEH